MQNNVNVSAATSHQSLEATQKDFMLSHPEVGLLQS